MNENVNTKENTESSSFRSILKSTTLIGGSSAINMVISMVRTKFVAILLGPTGVGLIGMYGQITGLAHIVSGMGLMGSGTRQVAESFGAGDNERLARTVKTLRRVTWLTGGLGMLALLALCVPVSVFTFESHAYVLPIAFLSVTLLIDQVSSSQRCVLMGTRRIRDIVKLSVVSALVGTLISIPCYYFWGLPGIVVSLILGSVATLVTSWWLYVACR